MSLVAWWSALLVLQALMRSAAAQANREALEAAAAQAAAAQEADAARTPRGVRPWMSPRDADRRPRRRRRRRRHAALAAQAAAAAARRAVAAADPAAGQATPDGRRRDHGAPPAGARPRPARPTRAARADGLVDVFA